MFPLWSWKGCKGFIGERNAEDIFGVGQPQLWVAVNGYEDVAAVAQCMQCYARNHNLHFELHLLPVCTLIQLGLIGQTQLIRVTSSKLTVRLQWGD